MRQFFRNNLSVLCTYFIVLCISCYFIANYNKTDIHLYLNELVGNKFIDCFFYFITYLGDGTIAIFLLALVVITNVRLGLYSTASFLTASLVSISLKRFLFDDVHRPHFVFTYFEHKALKLVENVYVYIHNSFPSGHATQAFAIFMCLAFVSQKIYVKYLLLTIALLTSYSRVHLSQHWLADITMGSVIGITVSIFYYYIFITSPAFNKLNKPIFVFIRLWRMR